MFWGLIMEPNKRYSQLVERSFHLSMASLDITGANDQPVQVMLCYENRNYLLCTLKKGSNYQVPLDLNFQSGTKIAFTCNGFGHVHLTGYLTLDEELDFDEEEEEEEEAEEEEDEEMEEEEDDEKQVSQTIKIKRKGEELSKKANKKLKVVQENTKDEDSSDENTFKKEDEGESYDEEMSDEESDDEMEEEEEDDSGEDDESEKDEPKQNQKQNQIVQKQDKQKMVNGKESKQDLNKQKKNKGEQQQQQQHKTRIVEGGVQIEELKVGDGAPAKFGRKVVVYYTGRLKNGKLFDETRQGPGFKFQLGKGEVIKGWDVGISGMKVGGKRRLTIPPGMAYGKCGQPPIIPGNSTLVFEVELRNVH